MILFQFNSYADNPYELEFKASDSFDMSLEDNLKEIKLIGNLEKDIRDELKEYFILKTHVKNQFINEYLLSATPANNDTFANPFYKINKKIKREIMLTGK